VKSPLRSVFLQKITRRMRILSRNGIGSQHFNSSFTSLESSGFGFGSPASRHVSIEICGNGLENISQVHTKNHFLFFRPITPAFPVSSTPYFNQSSSSSTLPPKANHLVQNIHFALFKVTISQESFGRGGLS
jgi:hypothetical protein